jgi:hypothetical protein
VRLNLGVGLRDDSEVEAGEVSRWRTAKEVVMTKVRKRRAAKMVAAVAVEQAWMAQLMLGLVRSCWMRAAVEAKAAR